jgi:hypothetical protein
MWYAACDGFVGGVPLAGLLSVRRCVDLRFLVKDV